MLHDKLARKLENQENKSFWNYGDIFWKDTELFINKVDSKMYTSTAKKGMNRLEIMQAAGLLTDSMRQDRFLSSLWLWMANTLLQNSGRHIRLCTE